MKKRLVAILFGLILALGLGAQSPVTITVEVFDRSAPGFNATNNWQTRWIQEQVLRELNIAVEFVAVPRGQEVEKLNILMAANQAPDLSFTYNESLVSNYVRSRGLTDLTRLIPRVAPDLARYLGTELMAFGEWGGRQWAIPARRMFTGAYSGFIRKDWLDALRLNVPTTTDELLTVLRAFRDRDPGRVGRDRLIPMALTLDPNNIHWTTNLIWEAFRRFNGVSEEVMVSSERWTMPGHKDAMAFLNLLHSERLISPNFVLDRDGQQYVRDIVQGTVGVFFHNWDQAYRANPGISTELVKNVPGASFVPFELRNRDTGRFNKWKYNPNGLFLFVPRVSERKAEAVLRYLNWMVRPDVLFMLTNGRPGVHFERLDNGVPVNFVPQDRLPDAEKWNAFDFALPILGKELGSEERNLRAVALSYTGFEELARQAAAISMRDAYVSFRFDEVLTNEARFRPTLNTMGAEIFVKSITARPADFSRTYDTLVAEYMRAGGTQIEQEKIAAYRKQMAERAAGAASN